MEAFSDGVIAIIITIMVLEMKAPHDADVAALAHLLPVFLSYVLSFIYVGIYWNNHHHLLHATKHVSGPIMWANLHLLFWLSLVPFVTAWMGENHNAPIPTALYGFVLLMAAVAFTILQQSILRSHRGQTKLGRTVGTDLKGKLSLLAYVAAIPLAFLNQWIADALFVAVALIWLIPDRRYAKAALPE
jgi:uncharacterized membrane protein